MQFALGVPLIFIAAYLVAIGYSVTARRTSHAMTAWIVRAIGVPQFFADKIVDGAIALTKIVTHELGEYAVPISRRVVGWIAGLAQYAALVGYWSLLWPKELYTFGYWLIHTYIPRALRGATKPIDRRARSAEAIARDAERRAINTRKGVPATAKPVVIETVPANVRGAARDIEWLRRHYKALTAAVAGAGAIALPWGGAGRLERKVGSLGKRIGKLEGLAAGLAAAGLVATALRKMGLGWTRCRNVGKVGKRLCGLDGSWLDLLLLDTVAILSIWSVREFAEALLEIEDEAVGILGHLIREFPETVAPDRPH